MARLHHVKKARKARPEHGIEIGDSFYWWANKTGPYSSIKRFSKTVPRPSQMTMSAFLSQQLGLGERLADDLTTNMSFEELTNERDDVVSEIESLGEEQSEKRDNMPEGLQEGPTGELLENRSTECESWASELESVDIPDSDDDVRADIDAEIDDDLTGEDREDEISAGIDNRKQEVIDELQGCEYQGE